MRKLLLQPLKLLLLACLLAVVTAPGSAYGQLPFTRTLFNAAYSPISVAGGASASTAVGDDVKQDTLPIGFTFNYLGNNFTRFGANSNGFIQLQTGPGLGTAVYNDILFASGSTVNAIGPWWDDLEGAVGTSQLLYQTTGVAGSRTLTVQWTNWFTFYTAPTTTSQINFQVVLHEGTNVIEFYYGGLTPGVFDASESASIGLKGATGGNGNYLDAVTGSGFVGHGFMQAQTKWPAYHYRFTPGAPTPLAGGTYNVGVGQTYGSLDRAVADINHRGITGPIVLSLTDANYDVTPANGDNIFPVVFGPITGSSLVNNVSVQSAGASPATLTYAGAGSGFLVSQVTASTVGSSSEPIICLLGSSFNQFNNLVLTSGGGTNLDRGILVGNGSATLGSQFNGFRNIAVTLNRSNTSTIGIEQIVITTPTNVTGTNGNCAYVNLNISNVYAGINLSGNGTFPDTNCVIGTLLPTTFNSIGSASANDIGNGTSATYGIRANNQASVSIFNNEVRNVTGNGVAVDGIQVLLAKGTSSVYRNKVYNLRNSSTTSTTSVNGIRANTATTGTHALRVYNNFVYNLTHAYTGAATANRILRGIYAQAAGGGVTTTSISVDNNSVALDGSGAVTGSNACFEVGTTSGVVFNVRNNIFANFTTGQNNGTSFHVGYYSTSATAIGNTGSVADRNDYYISDVTSGFVGRGSTTDYPTLASWQAAMVGQDANSITANPNYQSINSDLHISGLPLNAAASSIAYVTTDIDNDTRPATPDIGADEFTPATLDVGLYGTIAPVAGGCYTASQPVTVTLTNTATVPLDFTVNACTLNVAITGAVTTNLQLIINSNAVNGGAPLGAGLSVNVTVGNFNMSAAGTYTINGNVVLTGDNNAGNNTLASSTISYEPGTVTAARLNVCQGDSVLLTLTGATNTASLQWQSAPATSGPWTNVAGATNTTYVSYPTDTTYYRVLMCGSLASVFDTVRFIPTTTPTATGDTVCGLDTLVMTASGVGNLLWYAGPSGGSPINAGSVLDTVISSTTTFYVSSSSGGPSGSVGKFDITGGGGQQTSTAYNIFSVFQPANLVGAYVYPGAAGNVVCELRDNAGALITTRTVAVTAAQVGLRTYIPLNIPLPQGVDFRLAQGAGSVSMYRNSGGVAFPYTFPTVASITNSSAGNTFYYFFYDLQITTGCESARIPVTGTVLAPPAVNLALGDTTICQDYSTALLASSVDPSFSYSWTPSATLSSATGDSVTASPLSTTTYFLEAVNSQNCVVRDTITLAVNGHPAPVFAASDSLICVGNTATLGFAPPQTFWADSTDVPLLDNLTQTSVINVSNFAGTMGPNSLAKVCLDLTHSWDADMDISLVAPNGTVFDLSSDNGADGDNYLGTCFDMVGLNGPITAGTAPFTGSYLPEGAGGFGVFAGSTFNGAWTLQLADDASGDQGLLLNWSIEFANPAGVYTWSSIPAGFSSSADVVNVSPSVTTTYFVNVADSVTGCDTTYSFTLNVNPPLGVTTNAPANAVCAGTTVNLVATATGGNGAYSYDWDGVGTSSTYSIVVSSDTTVILTVTDSCGSTAVIDTIDILVAQPLAVTVVGQTICEGTSATLNANVTGGDGNYSYSWTGGATTNPLVVSPTTTTTYTVSVTDGCGGAPASNSAIVTVNPLPVAAFTTGNSAGGTTFANQSTNGTTYFWDFGDGNTSTLQNPTHLYDSSASFTACLTTTNACGSDTICSTLVSNEQAFGNGSVQLWPNPSMGKFNVRVTGLKGTDLTMSLYNMNGQRVLDQAFGTSFNTVEHTFNNELPAGAYFLRVNDGVHTATLRFVVQ
jgi:subtilisin-like proprotein convertase family protein